MVWYVLIINYLAHFCLFHKPLTKILVCLFDLNLYVPVNTSSVMLGSVLWVYRYLEEVMCQGNNTVLPVGLEHAAF